MSFGEKIKLEMPETVDNNTISNIIFLIAGYLAAALLGPPSLIGGFSLGYLFMGSGWYHYHDRHEYVGADWSAMYMVFTAQTGYYAYLIHGSIFFLFFFPALGVLFSYIHERMENNKILGMKEQFLVVGFFYTTSLIGSFILMPIGIATLSMLFYAAGWVSRTKAEQGGKYHPEFDQLKYDVLHGAWHWLVGIGIIIQIFGIWSTTL